MHTLAVVAIDIGATHSCCVFSFGGTPKKTCVIKTDSKTYQVKGPSTVLFTKNKEFHSYGSEAEDHFRSLRNDEERKRWYYFEGFNKVTSDSTVESTLSDVSGKKMDTYKVYGSAIKFFKDIILGVFRKNISFFPNQGLHFVMIVPTIFRRSYESILQQSFHYAGIEDDRYSFVRENIAVLSYWKYKWCETTELPNLTNGKCFLIVNLKGRTATITAQTAPDGTLNRLHNVTGGGWGGQAVNEEFKQLLIKLVGAPVFLKFVEEHEYDEWLHIQKSFELTKMSMCADSSDTVNVRIPFELDYIYRDCYNETIQDAVKASPYAEEIRIAPRRSVMQIDASVIKGLFKNTIKTIILNINDTLMNAAVKDKHTEVIILVGGFSDSPLIKHAIKQAFPDFQVIVPDELAFTTIEGAVLHGHHTKPALHCVEYNNWFTIHVKVSRFTYGVQICQVNDEGGRSEVGRSETKIFLRKGDVVYRMASLTWTVHLEACDEEHAEVLFFASPRNEALSADEEDVEYIKMIPIHFDGNFTKDVVISIYERNCCIMGEVSGQTVDFGNFE